MVAPSMGLKKVLQRLGVDASIEVVPNGVDVIPFHADVDPIDRAEFGFPEDAVVLTYAGRLGPEKNLSFFADF